MAGFGDLVIVAGLWQVPAMAGFGDLPGVA